MRQWKQGDWEIHLNPSDAAAGSGYCLRHIGCTTLNYPSGDKGQCSCQAGACCVCKVKVPEEIKGFFALVKWNR